MKAKIYCKATSKGIHTFYLSVDKKEYFLFKQNYRKSNREFFMNGKFLTEILNATNVHSHATRKTIEKLLPAINYIEKEYDIAVLEKTKRKDDKKRNYFKRKKFMFIDLDTEAA